MGFCPGPATTPTEPGSLTRPLLPSTTTPARRSSKAGIASPATNPTAVNSSSGGGSLMAVISRGFDPFRFLEMYRDSSIGFIGDSLNRNMSLFCSLKRVLSEVKKWRPVGADRGFTFLQYNVMLAYHRMNLLAHYGRWSGNPKGGVLESLGYKEGYRVDVDIPADTWAESLSFHDILIFNTGHCVVRANLSYSSLMVLEGLTQAACEGHHRTLMILDSMAVDRSFWWVWG